MAHLSGIFEKFPDLTQISAAEVNKWLTSPVEKHWLDNTIANKILYPQTIPVTKLDAKIDLVILMCMLRLYPEKIFKNNQITITDEFLNRFPSLEDLITSIARALTLPQITPIFIKKGNTRYKAGTIIKISSTEGNILINGKTQSLKVGEINFFPFKEASLIVEVKSNSPMQVSGGIFGLVLDLRREDE